MNEKNLDRKDELLLAAYRLLSKQKHSPFVLDILAETVHYDEADCDGYCLLNDIKVCLEEEGVF